MTLPSHLLQLPLLRPPAHSSLCPSPTELTYSPGQVKPLPSSGPHARAQTQSFPGLAAGSTVPIKMAFPDRLPCLTGPLPPPHANLLSLAQCLFGICVSLSMLCNDLSVSVCLPLQNVSPSTAVLRQPPR